MGSQRFEPKYRLAGAVDFYGNHLCADPRDKIYGLLGLVDFGDEPPIEADYSLSTEEVYQVYCSYIDREDSLEELKKYRKKRCSEAMGLDTYKAKALSEWRRLKKRLTRFHILTKW